jgi:hypothetical protein
MSGRYSSASTVSTPGGYGTATPHQPEHYPEAFRMTQKDIDDAPMVPHIPPLLAEDKR